MLSMPQHPIGHRHDPDDHLDDISSQDLHPGGHRITPLTDRSFPSNWAFSMLTVMDDDCDEEIRREYT